MALSDPLVVDASLAVKWFVQEQHSDLAEALQEDALSAHCELNVPPHFFGEVTNALYQKVRTTDPAKHVNAQVVRRLVVRLQNLPITVAHPVGLYEQAFDFATQVGLPSVYDSLYVVLAQMLGAELWTADARLLAAVGAHAPWVRSLADYQPPVSGP